MPTAGGSGSALELFADNSEPTRMDTSITDRSYKCKMHIKTGITLIIAVGVVALLGLTVFLSIYFRKALFVLSIPAIVTLLSAGAMFRRDHRFVWPLLGISCFHVFLALNILLVFAFYFFFKPLYILMVFNWAFDTLDTGKSALYYVKCLVIFALLCLFLAYNVWQALMAKHYLDYLRAHELELGEAVRVRGGSSGSSVALNYSQTAADSPKAAHHNHHHHHAAIVYVGGPDLPAAMQVGGKGADAF